MFSLSPRLAAVARMIPRGAALADIGSDHAYLPIYMIMNEAVASAIASDISAACIARAKANAAAYSVADRITFRQADGLSGISPDECDTIVLAGMGGETMGAILDTTLWALDKRLLLQPASRAPFLRRYLYAHGCTIGEECIVLDAGRLYPVLSATKGAPPEGELYEYASPALLGRVADPQVRTYLERTAALLAKEVGHDHRELIAALVAAISI
ncbi:MAG: class I SAM-dependent methyltransferase [Clostridiaceae bacterium]|nr:class I SAM-dependent methyltransferase [Clostridiaceae bacterium]